MSLVCGLRMASVIDRLGSGGCQRREVSAAVPQGTHVQYQCSANGVRLSPGPPGKQSPRQWLVMQMFYFGR